ncbi:serine hydrolase domain-containing protein [Pseudonocardia halophobica]|uniref:serine hydrolase domain-containing protein n=1 Tax=Pseudonocardia halophobica TaxID=29401 RepID=UPI001E5B6FAD|nr:serine hydrolase domain-containing protein [Pseudonocardia halophobica]
MRDEFARLLDTDEVGASVAVDLDGETVVDLWGGHRDEGRTTPWTRDTIVSVFSSSKPVTALAILVLVDRGLLDLDAPVAAYWPEFAAAGKEGVLVRHLMGHTSGLSGWEQPVTMEDLYDHESAVARLAAQTPWWTPGSAAGYHALTQGHLLGELVRRVDGRTLGRFIADELATPLKADVQLGVRREDDDRVAPVVLPPAIELDTSGIDPAGIPFRTMTGPLPRAELANTEGWRRAEVGAANVHTNARGLVDLMRVITLGGAAGGERLLSEATVDRVFEVQADGVDLVNGVHVRWGTGFGLTPNDAFPSVPTGRVCWWGGWGGSVIVMDQSRALTVSYTPNRMAAGSGVLTFERTKRYLDAVYSAL